MRTSVKILVMLRNLFADNEHSPHYYLQKLEEFDQSVYPQEDYSKGTTALLDQVEARWRYYVPFLCKARPCQILCMSPQRS